MGADGAAWLYSLIGGFLWNCGNILLVAGVALVGLAVAFPVSIGLALVVGVVGSYIVTPRGDPTLLFAGVALVLTAVLMNSMAYRSAAADKAVIFHCSNLPKHFFQEVRMDFNEIIGMSMGKEASFGTVVGRLKSGPMTYCRASTDDLHGRMRAYVGEGERTPDPIKSFGGYGVVRVPRLQDLLHYVCKNGYEHHVSVNLSRYGAAICGALGNYKGWEVHHHQPAGVC